MRNAQAGQAVVDVMLLGSLILLVCISILFTIGQRMGDSMSQVACDYANGLSVAQNGQPANITQLDCASIAYNFNNN